MLPTTYHVDALARTIDLIGLEKLRRKDEKNN